MATIRKQLIYDNSTDANFRSWGSQVSSAISSLGLVQTSDTGQINWASVTSPAQNTYAGYEIWKNSADPYFATLPIYFKIEYGTTNIPNGGPALRVQCGTGSDGSGTLTGTSMAATNLYATNSGVTNKGSSTINCYFHGDGSGSRLAMFLWADDTSGAAQTAWGYERSLDINGNYTGQYFTWVVGQHGFSAPVWSQNSIFAANSVFGSGTPTNTFLGVGGLSTYIGSVSLIAMGRGFPLLPIFPVVGFVGNPMTIFIGIASGDVALVNSNKYVTFQKSALYGQTLTYITSASNPFSRLTRNNLCGGMRYD